MKIVTVIGARPQFIKAAAVSRALRKKEYIREVIIHTGQHFDKNMSDIFFSEMSIPEPDYHLEINSLSHGAMTGRMIEGIENVILKEKPDMVMVYGDTNSTLAGALAAKKIHIRVAHVEAGLRSFNMNMPEEINRILTDRISDILFCPTNQALKNLDLEGFNHYNCLIQQVGDVMYDAALFYGAMSAQRTDIMHRLGLTDLPFVLCSVHRQENTDDLLSLKSIVESLNEINQNTRVILPLHPRTQKILKNNNITLDFNPIEPVGYFEIVALLKHCKLVITDSGGMQKEAYFFNKYCITLRNETEWIELVDNGYNCLAGSNKTTILTHYKTFIDKPFIKGTSLYGDGNAAEKIVSTLESHQ